MVEKKVRAELRIVVYQHRISDLYEKNIRPRSFKKDHITLTRVNQNIMVPFDGTFRAKWEGLYHVDKLVGSGAHRLLHIDGTIVKHLWNTAMLWKYY